MKTLFLSQLVKSPLVFTLLITGLGLTGCESNSVNGYFSNASTAPSSTSETQGSTVTVLPTIAPGATVTPMPTLPLSPTPDTSGTPSSTPSPSGPSPSVSSSAPSPSPLPSPSPSVDLTAAPVSTPPTIAAGPTPTQTPVVLPSTFVPDGILNGHFDVDTATTSTPFPIGDGFVTYHVHEYDKMNKTTTVDFFNLINSGGSQEAGGNFDQVQKSFSKSKRFYLVVVNAGLNPGGVLELNGSVLRVTDYQNLNQQLLSGGVRPPAYTIGTPSVEGDTQLKSLKIAFDSTVTANSLLIPTGPTNCVFPNIPGKFGEYRDGALVVQAIDANVIELNAATGAATSSGGLLWEGIIYNHYMGTDPNDRDPEYCY